LRPVNSGQYYDDYDFDDDHHHITVTLKEPGLGLLMTALIGSLEATVDTGI